MKNIDSKIVSGVVKSSVLTLILSGCAQFAFADIIPYPNVGTENPVTYTFTATSTGPLTGYFAGSTAGYDEVVGLSINGANPLSYGLDDHSSTIGDSFDFGNVTAGDTLTFVLHVFDTAGYVYSNPSLNAPYDGSPNHNHVYSTAYSAADSSTPALAAMIAAGIPAGKYVAFEDLAAGGSDNNYFDDTFVFVNTTTTETVVPEPSTWIAGGLMLLPFSFCTLRLLRNKKLA